LTAPPEPEEPCGAMDGLAMGPDPKLVLLVAIFAFFSFYIMNSSNFLRNDASAEINEIQMRMTRCVLGACPDVASAV
jgi:hypothetical protein